MQFFFKKLKKKHFIGQSNHCEIEKTSLLREQTGRTTEGFEMLRSKYLKSIFGSF